MKLNSKDLIDQSRNKESENYWVCREILDSLPKEFYEQNKPGENGYELDIKLQINGILVEPKLLETIFKNIEEIIDREALGIANKKMSSAMNEVETLNEIIKEAEYKIREKFQIPNEEE